MLELTDKASGDPGTLSEFNGSQSPCLAHMSELVPQMHWSSLILLVELDVSTLTLDVCFVSQTPVERHARVGGHPVPRPSSPGFPLARE